MKSEVEQLPERQSVDCNPLYEAEKEQQQSEDNNRKLRFKIRLNIKSI